MKANNKIQITEVKKGQSGYGLLVEHDGHVSLNKEQLIKENAEDGGWHCPNPFLIDCILQKADIKNANGRVYPRAILEREVENYKTRIAERRALGECYTPDVLVLTEDGWKQMADVKEGDKVLTLNTTTNEIEIQAVVRKIEKDYNGKMIRIQGRHFNDLVTPNHGYPLYKNNSFQCFKTAQEIFDSKGNELSNYYIPKNGIWTNKGDEFFTLKGLTNVSEQLKRVHPDAEEDKLIPMDSFMKFLGIYLSEGDYRKNNSDVNISQKKEEVCQEILEMLPELGLNYTVNQKPNDCKVFRINDPRLNEFVSQFGNCYNKFIPKEIKNQSKENLRILYEWFVKGDGRKRGTSDDVFTTSKQLGLDLNEIQMKIGNSGSWHCEERNEDRMFGDRVILAENSHDLYFTRRNLSKGVYLDKRFIKTSEEDYEGQVMCIEVPNHTFYVMSNGVSHWSKNCDHPSESTISLKNISHNIVDIWWEKDTVMGKLELNTSEGFRRHGIVSTAGDQCANMLLNGYKLGISSRAIGSVEEKMGLLVVQDDLEVIGWDIVADPSTPKAYLGDREELEQYVEADMSNKNKPSLNEKINKIKNLLE